MARTKNFYTTREAAKLLGISVCTAQQWVERRILEGWKTEGGHRRISAKSVDLMCHKQAEAGGCALPVTKLRILIIEDDQSLLRLYRANFSLWPFPVEVFTAPNGFEGLVMVGEMAPHLLICDLRLPGVNGFQIVRALREIPRYKDLAIVVVSGMPLNEIDAHGGLQHSIETMGKPIDFDRLKAIALEVLAGINPTGFRVVPPA